MSCKYFLTSGGLRWRLHDQLLLPASLVAELACALGAVVVLLHLLLGSHHLFILLLLLLIREEIVLHRPAEVDQAFLPLRVLIGRGVASCRHGGRGGGLDSVGAQGPVGLGLEVVMGRR
jgi:hypothetical protein